MNDDDDDVTFTDDDMDAYFWQEWDKLNEAAMDEAWERER
jgi:hypothetical protein